MASDKSNNTSDQDQENAPEDPVVTYILNAVDGGGEVSPNHIAQKIASDRSKPTDPNDIWRKYMTAVRQQAIHLARTGRIEIVRKGVAVDPNDFKGLYKLRLPQK
ncbi:DUF3253 domain-containing protein [Sneathiella aquimaris]|uniref:DUF3253 domain-containing protein n=1 Tax=Sneathiella aquimaris TaxID=2599305 RepID=UPI00146B6628|nr:DUF3253 domain-containing protein [Sneathiella aquimaris]